MAIFPIQRVTNIDAQLLRRSLVVHSQNNNQTLNYRQPYKIENIVM